MRTAALVMVTEAIRAMVRPNSRMWGRLRSEGPIRITPMVFSPSRIGRQSEKPSTGSPFERLRALTIPLSYWASSGVKGSCLTAVHPTTPSPHLTRWPTPNSLSPRQAAAMSSSFPVR